MYGKALRFSYFTVRPFAALQTGQIVVQRECHGQFQGRASHSLRYRPCRDVSIPLLPLTRYLCFIYRGARSLACGFQGKARISLLYSSPLLKGEGLGGEVSHKGLNSNMNNRNVMYDF